MRRAMYEPVAGLPAEMASPEDIGLTTGAGSGGISSQDSITGLLKLEPTKLANALASNPGGVQQMLQKWSLGLQHTINAIAEPGASLDSRITSEGSQIAELHSHIASMNELLAVREKALQQTYSQLEGIISQNMAQSNWLVSQSEGLTKAGI